MGSKWKRSAGPDQAVGCGVALEAGIAVGAFADL